MADQEDAVEGEFLEDGVTPNPDYKKPDDEGGDTVPDDKDGDDGDGSSDDDDEDDDADDGAGDDDADVDVPVRKSVQQQIITRQKKTIKKLRSKDDDDDGDGEEDDDDGELTPEASTTIKDEVNKAVKPLKDAITGKIDTDELDSLLTSIPEAKKYENRIKKYMAHPSWAEVPPRAIFHHLAFEAAQKIGLKKKEVADKEANQNRSAGDSIRDNKAGDGNVPSIDEMGDMSDAEFDKLQHDALTGKFTKK